MWITYSIILLFNTLITFVQAFNQHMHKTTVVCVTGWVGGDYMGVVNEGGGHILVTPSSDYAQLDSVEVRFVNVFTSSKAFSSVFCQTYY